MHNSGGRSNNGCAFFVDEYVGRWSRYKLQLARTLIFTGERDGIGNIYRAKKSILSGFLDHRDQKEANFLGIGYTRC